jgi:predicted RNA binding protein YcfA (HicA-like mRNA interferase family)
MTGALPVANARQVVAALRRAGYVTDRIAGSHYIMKHSNDPALAVTVPFHGSRDIKPGTLRNIIRQANLTVDEFRALL